MPTMSTCGCRRRISCSMRTQSGPSLRTCTAGRGAGLAVTVSAAAMPMRRKPKSKATRVCGRASGIARDGAQLLHIDAEQLPRSLPALRERELKHQTLIGRHWQPCVLADLALELTRIPACIAERDERVRGTLAARHRREHVARGRDLNELGDGVGGIPIAPRAMQHEAAVRLHWSAPQNRLLTDLLVTRLELHLCEHFGQAHRQWPVEHDAERATVGVFADQ